MVSFRWLNFVGIRLHGEIIVSQEQSESETESPQSEVGLTEIEASQNGDP